MCAISLQARLQASKFRYAALAEEDKIEEVFDACCVTNEHARVPIPTYQGSTSRINLDDKYGYEGDKKQSYTSCESCRGWEEEGMSLFANS